jgi:SAM-dependent methyltransferase
MLSPALVSMGQKLVFMAISLSFLPPTVWSLLLARDFGTLLSWSRLRAAWFGRFWAHVAPGVREIAEPAVVPLLQGRVSRGRILPPPHKENSSDKGDKDADEAQSYNLPASGTLLEIGPGSGMWTSLFTPSNLPQVRKIYGVEPNAGVHSLLRSQIATAGLDDGTYEIVPLGIEDLAASGRVPLESVDCIVTIMCLCSIPDPQHNMAQLYGYLKPGGRWYVYEHVKCFAWQGRGIGLYQSQFLHFALSRFLCVGPLKDCFC